MRTISTLVFTMTVAGGCAHERDTRWERSRTAYCDEVELLQRYTTGVLAHLAEELALASRATERSDACRDVEASVRELETELRTFNKVSDVLARGRAETQTVEQAGFVLANDLPFRTWAAGTCRTDVAKATASVGAMKEEAARLFSQRLGRCTAIGWTPPPHSTATARR